MVTDRRQANVEPRRGAVSKEALVGSALVALIGICIVLVLRTLLAGPDPRDPGKIRADKPMVFQCDLCGHKFSMIPTEFHKQWIDVDPSKWPPGSWGKANCPKCGKPYCCTNLSFPPKGQRTPSPAPQAR